MQISNNYLHLTLIQRTGNYASNCKMADSDINLVLQLSSFEGEIWSSNFINEWAVIAPMTDEKIIIKTQIVFHIYIEMHLIRWKLNFGKHHKGVS